MDFSWAYIVVPFIFAGAGAYFGSYLKTKGKNLATKEDIDGVVEQVKLVTKATKEIEAKISNDVWDRQKQWELKREVLFEATKRLSDLDNKLLALNTFWQLKSRGGIDKTSKIQLQHKCVTEWKTSLGSFEEVESLVYVTCSAETMRAFAGFSDLMRRTAGEIVNNNPDAYLNGKQERNFMLTAVRVAIRKAFGAPLEITPQSTVSSAAPSPG
jgi:hypothetical protein